MPFIAIINLIDDDMNVVAHNGIYIFEKIAHIKAITNWQGGYYSGSYQEFAPMDFKEPFAIRNNQSNAPNPLAPVDIFSITWEN